MQGKETLADRSSEGGFCYILTERLPGHNVTALELLEPENARHEGVVAIAGLHRALKDMEAPVEEKDLLSTLKNWAVPMAKEAIGLLEHLQEL